MAEPPIEHALAKSDVPVPPEAVANLKADTTVEGDAENLRKAEVTPARVADVPTTHDEAPAVASGDTERPDEPGLEDLGWSEEPDVPVPVLHGMRNEMLWVLVRRFNKQMYHVKAIPHPPPGRLDLNIADEDDFSPDKLRAGIERLYMTVIVGLVAVGKHIARLRSWHEQRRTAGFCAAYFIAWIFNMIVPLILSTMLVLIVFPPSRTYLFPPAPIAAISGKTGTVQVPKAGHLGSKNSLTGAAESYKGEAVEQEASNFTAGLASLAVGTATGAGAPSAQENVDEPGEEKEIADGLPDPTQMASGASEAQSKAAGEKAAKHDKTKKPVENAIWEKARPTMHIIGDIANGWERFGNALCPQAPFSSVARLRLGAIVLPLVLASLFISSSVVYKGTTFGIGFGMFGQPVIDRMAQSGVREWLDRDYPGWRKALELRNSILLGVPTNAQLTITLLRIGEANKAPLPPPPPAAKAPPPPVPASAAEADADAPPEYAEEQPGDVKEGKDAKPAKKPSKVLGFLKGTTKAGVESALGMDRVKAIVGSEHAKTRIGVVAGGKGDKSGDGPVSFKARHHGKRGLALISTTATTPCISFERDSNSPLVKPEPVFSIAIDDIREIRKVGGLGWKSKIVVGWALGSEVADGIEIIDALGQTYKLTAMQRRDELFNRVIAMGDHKWESW